MEQTNTLQTRNQRLAADSTRYIWYPFTQMQDYAHENPIIIEAAEGNLLRDIDGNEYIDGVSSLWTNVHGHGKAKLNRAIEEQLAKVAHSTLLGLSNIPAIECAKKLVEITPPSLSRVFYSDSGSTAVEIALKIVFQYHQQAREGNPKKTRFISLRNAYHGDTIGSVSVGGMDLFHATYKALLFQSIQVESPYCYRCPFGQAYPGCDYACLAKMEATMAAHADEVAALVIEPMVQGAAGMLVQPAGYLKRVRELCRRYGIFMIADEVAVGFGKTGKMFACEHEDVEPDIMTVAKGISGGYLPLAATLVSEKIYQGFLGEYEEFKTFFHGHTYTGNPLACAAAVANMELFEEEGTLEKLKKVISYLTQRLQPLWDLEHVGDIRQCGIMVGIELVADKSSRQPYPPQARIGNQVIMEARKHGVIIRPLGDVIILMPPLSITLPEIDRLCEAVYQSVKTVTSSAP